MLPLAAGMVGRAALTAGSREAAGGAVTAAARSGAISAGTSPDAGTGSRVLSAMQFGSSAVHATRGGNDNPAPPPAPAPADDLGWARS